MKRLYSLSIIILSFVLMACSSNRSISSFQQDITENKKLKVQLESIREQYKIPSIAAVIVNKDKIISIAATGKRAINFKETVTINDKYHLGSNTKSMTAMLLAKLIEKKEDTFSWEQSLKQSFPGYNVHKELQNITLEDLLRHQSGITSSMIKSYPKLFKQFVKMQSSQNPEAKKQRSLLAQRALNEAPAFEPQRSSNYSNVGIATAGHAIEIKLKEDYEKILKKYLFDLLVMNNCGFGTPQTRKDKVDHPRGHYIHQEKTYSVPPGPLSDNVDAISPAGKVHCSVLDWGRYISENLKGNIEGTSYLSKKSFQKLHTPVINQRFALGWLEMKPKWLKGKKAIFHNGSNTMNYAEMWFVPDSNIGIGVVTNLGTKSAMEAVRKVVEEILTGPRL